jgi:hypothetical protein
MSATLDLGRDLCGADFMPSCDVKPVGVAGSGDIIYASPNSTIYDADMATRALNDRYLNFGLLLLKGRG